MAKNSPNGNMPQFGNGNDGGLGSGGGFGVSQYNSGNAASFGGFNGFNGGFMGQPAPQPQRQQQTNNSETFDNIMRDFNQPRASQQFDFNQNAVQSNTPQVGGMPNQAGGYLPELDYIPEATNGMNAVRGTGAFSQNMGTAGNLSADGFGQLQNPNEARSGGNFDSRFGQFNSNQAQNASRFNATGFGSQNQFNGRNLQADPNQLASAQQGRQRAEDSMYGKFTSRLDPKFENDEKQLQIDLRNRGLSEGDAAYDSAMDNFGREKTDAYQQASFNAVNNAGAEAERNFGMDSQRRSQMFGEQESDARNRRDNFGVDQSAEQQAFSQTQGMSQDDLARSAQDMQAQDQAFGQQMGMSQDEMSRMGMDLQARAAAFGEKMGLSKDEITRIGIDLEGRAQQFGEQMGMSKDEITRLGTDMQRQELIQTRAAADQNLSIRDQQLMLQGDQQMFNQQMGASQFQNQARQQQIAEETARRNQSLNELNALLSGSQVQSPQFAGYNTAGNAGGVDYSGAGRNQYGASVDAANIRNAAIGNAINGAGNIAGMFSDERLKTDIAKVGERNGFNLYTWTWNELMPEAFKRGKKGFGVIAQEVAKVMPSAIIIDNTGFMKVNYHKILGE